MNMIHMINRYLGEMENSRMIRMIDKFGNACSRNIYQWKLYLIFWDSLSSLTQSSHAKIGLPALSGRGNLHVGTFICAQVFVESGIFTTWRFRHVFNLTPGWLYWQVKDGKRVLCFGILCFGFKIFKLLQMFHQVDQARLTIRTQYPSTQPSDQTLLANQDHWEDQIEGHAPQSNHPSKDLTTMMTDVEISSVIIPYGIVWK